MNRRLFFQALAGAPVVALPSIPKPPAVPMVQQCDTGVCCAECGMVLANEGNYWDRNIIPYFVRCQNEECRLHRVPLEVPKVLHPTKLADPKRVAEIDESYRLAKIEERIRSEQPKWSQFWGRDMEFRGTILDHGVVMNKFQRAHELWCHKYNRTEEPNWY